MEMKKIVSEKIARTYSLTLRDASVPRLFDDRSPSLRLIVFIKRHLSSTVTINISIVSGVERNLTARNILLVTDLLRTYILLRHWNRSSLGKIFTVIERHSHKKVNMRKVGF